MLSCSFFTILFSIVFSRLVFGDQLPLASSLHAKWDEDAKAYLLKLPYATYTGTLDAANEIVVFSNVRYAAPPLGNNRWQKPQPPSNKDSLVAGTCFQAYPEWWGLDSPNDKYPKDRFPHPGFNLTSPEQEDCLFLDVYVPKSALDNPPNPPLPVLFWIYGGGYVAGSKDYYPGTPLLKASANSIIYVAPNYRVGAFGFLASSLVEGSTGKANAGFWDQRFALNWTAEYIGRVGGDPNQITVMGESAGGGSIMHHLTSPHKPLFKRAIVQSPAFDAQFDSKLLVTQFQNFAKAAGCGNSPQPLACLRGQASQVLQNANKDTIRPALYGTFTYGPAVDGDFVPNLPGIQLKNGKFNNVQVMLGHNSDEGFIFTPDIITNGQFNNYITSAFPTGNAAFLRNVNTTYYPPPPIERYYTEFTRLEQLIAESGVTCNTLYTSNAYGRHNTYNYEFAAGTGYHGFDLCWTFAPNYQLLYDGIDICKRIANDAHSLAFQTYLVSFAMTGNPNSLGGPVSWPTFGSAGDILYMDIYDPFKIKVDKQVPADRCGFWQCAPYCSNCGPCGSGKVKEEL